METLTVQRGDLALKVLPAPCRDLWDFWGQFAAGRWEPGTFEVLDQFLTPDGTYVDLGAWIGPTVLYAAGRCGLVVAVEPDPVAVEHLTRNLALNDVTNVQLVFAAVDTHRDGASLYMHGLWGDSMSTTMVPGPLNLSVPTLTLPDLIRPLDRVDLIKIDIEGAESRVLPDAVGYLAERRIPCLVSLHEDFYGPGGPAATRTALNEFDKVTVLDTDAPSSFRTVLCEWE